MPLMRESVRLPDRRRWPWQKRRTTLTPPGGWCSEHWEGACHKKKQNRLNEYKDQNWTGSGETLQEAKLTRSDACWASPLLPSRPHLLSRYVYAIPRPTPPAPGSTGWPCLHQRTAMAFHSSSNSKKLVNWALPCLMHKNQTQHCVHSVTLSNV